MTSLRKYLIISITSLAFFALKPDAGTNTAKLLFAGDVMFEWGVSETLDHLPPEHIVSELVPVFKEADFRMLNLETPVIPTDFVTGDSMLRDKAYVFRSKPSDLDLLKYLSVDLVFLGNNHAMDYGKDGFLNTIKFLDERKIAWTGAGINSSQAYAPYKLENGSNEFLIVSASEYGAKDSFAGPQNPGMAKLSLKDLANVLISSMSSANGKKQIPIASLHWGLEYSPVPETYQKKIAHSLIDTGFSAIIGHHPHISQGIEKYKDGIIFYSLGNFVFGSKNQLLSHNLVPILHYEDGKLKMAEIVPVFGKFQELDSFYTYPLTGKEADDFLRELFIQCRNLDTDLEIRNNRGYIHF